MFNKNNPEKLYAEIKELLLSLRSKYENVRSMGPFMTYIDEELEHLDYLFDGGYLNKDKAAEMRDDIDRNVEFYEDKYLVPTEEAEEQTDVLSSNNVSTDNESHHSSTTPVASSAGYSSESEKDENEYVYENMTQYINSLRSKYKDVDGMQDFINKLDEEQTFFDSLHFGGCLNKITEEMHRSEIGYLEYSFLQINGLASQTGYFSSDSSNVESTEVSATESMMVRELHFSVYLPTKLPKNRKGKLKLDVDQVNRSILSTLDSVRRYNPKMSGYEFGQFYGKDNCQVSLKYPVKIDDEADAWFFVDVKFDKDVDKLNMPEDELRTINYYIYRIHGYNRYDSFSYGYDNYYLDIDFYELERDDYAFLRACIKRST